MLPWGKHLHFRLQMVILNHAQSSTAQAWKYFSLDIINLISHNNCVVKKTPVKENGPHCFSISTHAHNEKKLYLLCVPTGFLPVFVLF